MSNLTNNQTMNRHQKTTPARQLQETKSNPALGICKDGEYIGDLPEGASTDSLVCFNGEPVQGSVKNINGNAVAIVRQN